MTDVATNVPIHVVSIVILFIFFVIFCIALWNDHEKRFNLFACNQWLSSLTS